MIFTGLSHLQDIGPVADLALARTDNVNVRFAAGVALLFNVLMLVVAITTTAVTVPQANRSSV